MAGRRGISFEVELEDGQEWVECPAEDCRNGYRTHCLYCEQEEDDCDCGSKQGLICPTCNGQGGFDV